jgi:glycosyltransferase involved in cell wall biosynthesis
MGHVTQAVDAAGSAIPAPMPSMPLARNHAARKTRVLHIIKTLTLGGAETNLLNLARAFDSEKIENHVAYSYGGEIEQRFRDAGMRLFKYSEQSHRVKSLHTIAITLRLAAYVRKHGIDIVQTHNFNGHIWGLLAAKLGGARLIEHVHDFRYTPADELARRHGLLDQYRFIKYFRNQSDRVVVLTHANAEYVVANKIASADRVVELQNGIPLEDTRPAASVNLREKFGIAEGAVVVLTSARMDPTKNIDLILRIAGRVAQAAPHVVFLLAGNGAHLDEYQEAARRKGLNRHVRFIGYHQDMYGLLGVSDVFLLPSFLELHSIAILEALRMSVPVVVSQDVGCNGEFIDNGQNGFLCDPFQEQPWIDALVRLCNDPSLREQVGRRGFATCARLFNIRDTASRFEKVYSELMV